MKTKKIKTKADITVKEINALIDEVNGLRIDSEELDRVFDILEHFAYIMAQEKETNELLIEHIKDMFYELADYRLAIRKAERHLEARWSK